MRNLAPVAPVSLPRQSLFKTPLELARRIRDVSHEAALSGIAFTARSGDAMARIEQNGLVIPELAREGAFGERPALHLDLLA